MLGKSRGILWLLVVLLGLLVLAGCSQKGANPEAQKEGTAPGTGEKAGDRVLKVAVILPGKVDDVSWNQVMYQGMKALENEYKDKIKVTYVEDVYDVSAIEPTLRDFASQGYDLIFGHGFQFQEPIIKVAQEFPKVNFALGTGFKTLPNTCVYDVKLEDGGYLMGTLAALISKTNKLGVVGGVDVSEIYRGHEAYKLGARKIKPNIEIQEIYTGDWGDAGKAREAAMSMDDSGVDIIWHSGDGIGLGAVDAAKEKNKLVLGNVADQNVLAPNNVLSGIVYNWTPVAKQIVDDILNNNFTNRQDKFYWLSAANGGIKVAPFHGLEGKVPQEIKDKLAEVQKGLADGSIKLPEFKK